MIVCADDFGLCEDVDRAILGLCASGKLSAVSCMVALRRCAPESLARLRQLQPAVDVGLHLCLTDDWLSFSAPAVAGAWTPFGTLFRHALLGRLDRRQLLSAIAAQYELFAGKTGRPPDFIDGHLHVHQLPLIRDSLIEFVSTLPPGSRPYVRNTHLPFGDIVKGGLPWLKAAGIGAFGAGMRRRLQARGVATNSGFAGIYDFRNSHRYAQYLPRFVHSLRHANGILVAHPGEREEWRRREREALRDFSFPAGTPNRYRR